MRKVGCLGLLLGLVAIIAAVVVVRSWGGSGPAQRTVTVQVAGSLPAANWYEGVVLVDGGATELAIPYG